MIVRVWRGWTTKDNAEAYERLLNGTIAPGIMQRGIAGLRDLSVLRKDGDEVEFVTMMTFDDWAAVEAFAGPDSSASVVPPAARAVLARFDEHSEHYELLRKHTS
jgi:hypothetical protein